MRRAIVTGGSRGIGYAIAKAILSDGGQVMSTGLDRGRLEGAVRQLGRETGASGRVAGAPSDVRLRREVDALVADTAQRFGGLDTLVNNAGIGVWSDVADTTDEDWHRVLETNLTGPFLCARAAIPLMRQAGGGWIINIASLAGRNAFPGGGVYCASKAALISFSESMMQEVRFDNIRVSVVMPGSVATEFSARSADDDDSWKLTPDDVALAVMNLLNHPARSLPSKVELRPAKTRQRQP
jgi:NAD(P)-dependent dehydrogenase (short-subunit alcohol dehydrogenase family)